MSTTIIKKYSNRRLYDTSQSQYITLEELANKIRAGHEIKVIDAKSEDDLTQAVLAQIIIESRGAARLLPAKMLTQLIRMEDDALAEFFGHYMSWALAMYLRVRQRARHLSNPFGMSPPSFPFGNNQGGAQSAMGQWMGALYGWPGFQGPPPNAPHAGGPHQHIDPFEGLDHPDPTAPPESETARHEADHDGMAQMRRELDELKGLLRQIAAPNKAPDEG